jgi:hypothetical protein
MCWRQDMWMRLQGECKVRFNMLTQWRVKLWNRPD